jgi:uracil-DNA glycosylase family 4
VSIVKNEFPTEEHPTKRLAVVGEAPGKNEVDVGAPFVGASGQMLNSILGQNALPRSNVFVGNVCQVRPAGNKISNFEWTGDEIQSGIRQLRADLKEFKPNCVLCLGNSALRAFAGGKLPIGDFRGSVLKSPTFGVKFVASYHPAAIFRQYKWSPLLRFDTAKAVAQSSSSAYHPPALFIEWNLSLTEIVERLRLLRSQPRPTSCDIEGGIYNGGMSCISFTLSPSRGFMVPFAYAGKSLWSVEEEALLWKELALTLTSDNVKFTLQNGLYDLMVMAYKHHLLVHNFSADTMLSHWELYPELEKNLGIQTSIYTNIPFYKDERKQSDTKQRFFTYGIKDSIATEQCGQRQRAILNASGSSNNHYKFNIRCLKPILYMQLRGFKFDHDAWINLYNKKHDEWVKEQYKFETMIGHELNVKSWTQKVEFLYKELGLKKPARVKGQGSDELTILKLARQHQDLPELQQLVTTIRLRTFLSDMRKLVVDSDGRIKCSYNLAGTETARLSSAGSIIPSPTTPPFLMPDYPEFKKMYIGDKRKAGGGLVSSVGTNFQNQTEIIRVCFRADDGFALWQCDLSGADTWTVACRTADLGDTTLLEDVQEGLKPAKILMLTVEHGNDIVLASRSVLKELTAKLKIPKDPDSEMAKMYAAFKAVVHGSNYELGPEQMSDTVFIRSKGSIYVEPAFCQLGQALYFKRYWGIKEWQKWVNQKLKNQGYFICASGFKRTFFGRKNEHSTYREALATEPQANTTWATKLALEKLYYSEWNRTDGFPVFKAEPLHTVHDSAIGQFRLDDPDAGVRLVKRSFDNPVTIGGHRVVIPYDGGWGPNWHDLPNEI